VVIVEMYAITIQFFVEGWIMFKLVDLMAKGLDATSLRHKVLSNNLANANTPHFRRSDVDFSTIFQQSATLPVVTTHSRHIPSIRKKGTEARIIQDRTTALRNDGSNVDVDREMVLLLENQLHYQAMADVISRRLNLLRTVIGEGR